MKKEREKICKKVFKLFSLWFIVLFAIILLSGFVSAINCPPGYIASGVRCIPPACIPNWQCTDWGSCQMPAGSTTLIQLRECNDTNNCPTPAPGKPATSQYCCSNECVIGQTRCNENIYQICDMVYNCPKWINNSICGNCEICNVSSIIKCNPDSGKEGSTCSVKINEGSLAALSSWQSFWNFILKIFGFKINAITGKVITGNVISDVQGVCDNKGKCKIECNVECDLNHICMSGEDIFGIYIPKEAYKCVNNKCVVECSTDTDCSLRIDGKTKCIGSRCSLPLVGTKCEFDEDCNEDLVCNEFNVCALSKVLPICTQAGCSASICDTCYTQCEKCPAGQKLNGLKCECVEEGQKMKNGACACVDISKILNPTTGKCSCRPGLIANGDGNCVCPYGETLSKDGKCIGNCFAKILPPGVTDSNAVCECPAVGGCGCNSCTGRHENNCQEKDTYYCVEEIIDGKIKPTIWVERVYCDNGNCAKGKKVPIIECSQCETCMPSKGDICETIRSGGDVSSGTGTTEVKLESNIGCRPNFENEDSKCTLPGCRLASELFKTPDCPTCPLSGNFNFEGKCNSEGNCGGSAIGGCSGDYLPCNKCSAQVTLQGGCSVGNIEGIVEMPDVRMPIRNEFFQQKCLVIGRDEKLMEWENQGLGASKIKIKTKLDSFGREYADSWSEDGSNWIKVDLITTLNPAFHPKPRQNKELIESIRGLYDLQLRSYLESVALSRVCNRPDIASLEGLQIETVKNALGRLVNRINLKGLIKDRLGLSEQSENCLACKNVYELRKKTDSESRFQLAQAYESCKLYAKAIDFYQSSGVSEARIRNALMRPRIALAITIPDNGKSVQLMQALKDAAKAAELEPDNIGYKLDLYNLQMYLLSTVRKGFDNSNAMVLENLDYLKCYTHESFVRELPGVQASNMLLLSEASDKLLTNARIDRGLMVIQQLLKTEKNLDDYILADEMVQEDKIVKAFGNSIDPPTQAEMEAAWNEENNQGKYCDKVSYSPALNEIYRMRYLENHDSLKFTLYQQARKFRFDANLAIQMSDVAKIITKGQKSTIVIPYNGAIDYKQCLQDDLLMSRFSESYKSQSPNYFNFQNGYSYSFTSIKDTWGDAINMFVVENLAFLAIGELASTAGAMIKIPKVKFIGGTLSTSARLKFAENLFDPAGNLILRESVAELDAINNIGKAKGLKLMIPVTNEGEVLATEIFYNGDIKVLEELFQGTRYRIETGIDDINYLVGNGIRLKITKNLEYSNIAFFDDIAAASRTAFDCIPTRKLVLNRNTKLINHNGITNDKDVLRAAGDFLEITYQTQRAAMGSSTIPYQQKALDIITKQSAESLRTGAGNAVTFVETNQCGDIVATISYFDSELASDLGFAGKEIGRFASSGGSGGKIMKDLAKYMIKSGEIEAISITNFADAQSYIRLFGAEEGGSLFMNLDFLTNTNSGQSIANYIWLSPEEIANLDAIPRNFEGHMFWYKKIPNPEYPGLPIYIQYQPTIFDAEKALNCKILNR